MRGLLITGPFLVEHQLQGTQALVVAAHGLCSCSSRVVEHDSIGVAQGLSCFMAYGIFPDHNFDSKSLPLPTTFLTTLTSWEWETEDASLHLTHNTWLGSGWPFPGSQDQEGLFAVLCGKASLPWHSLATTS